MPSTEPLKLTAAEARVLGSLIEKEVTTPDYYPLTLNALVNACNQRSNREPVMDLDEDEVRLSLRGLEDRRLAGRARSQDGRVTKYEHWLGEAFNFSRAETAIICALLLRGPQTPGELRSRTERMHTFPEIGDVLASLQKLIERNPPLSALLPRQPGARESRYVHLLSDPAPSMDANTGDDASEPVSSPVLRDPLKARVAQLEAELIEVRAELNLIRSKIDDFFA
jgi:uncharacterized protein